MFPGGRSRTRTVSRRCNDSIHCQEVGDRELFEALHEFPVQGPEFGVPDVLFIVCGVFEVERIRYSVEKPETIFMISLAFLRSVVIRASIPSIALL